MLELIKFLAQEKKKSIVLSSHILPDVEHVCENIVVLAGGEVLMQGNLQEQLSGEGDIVNVRFQGNISDFSRCLEGSGYRVEEHEAQMIRISTDDSDTETAEIFKDIMRCASENGCQIRYASRNVMNLEDLFITIVENREGTVQGMNRGPGGGAP